MGWITSTVSKATGVDEDKIKGAAAVLNPVGAAATGEISASDAKRAAEGAAGTLQGMAKPGDPMYKPKEPSVLAKPVMPEGAAPTTVTLPDAFKGATIKPVTGPAAPDFAGSAQATALQSNLANDLAAASRGEGPSLATEQLKQAQAANIAATYSMLASQRGGPTAGGARTAMQTSADIQAKTAQDAAMARIQEQLGARQQLAGVTGQMRAGDVAEVGLEAQTALAKYKGDLDLAVEQGRMDQATASQVYKAQVDKAMQDAAFKSEYNNRIDKYVQMGLSVDEANQRASIDMERIRAGIPNAPSQLDQIMKFVSPVASGVATIYGGPMAGAGTAAALKGGQNLADSTSDYEGGGEGELVDYRQPNGNTYTA